MASLLLLVGLLLQGLLAGDPVTVPVEVVHVGPDHVHPPRVGRSVPAAADAVDVARYGHAPRVRGVAAVVRRGWGRWRWWRRRRGWCRRWWCRRRWLRGWDSRLGDGGGGRRPRRPRRPGGPVLLGGTRGAGPGLLACRLRACCRGHEDRQQARRQDGMTPSTRDRSPTSPVVSVHLPACSSALQSACRRGGAWHVDQVDDDDS